MTNSMIYQPPIVSASNYASYFSQLYKLMLSVITIKKDGIVLSIDEGTDLAVGFLEEVKTRDAKVMIVGNGGSAAIASHQAIDLWNAAGIPATTFNDPAQITCISNDYGYESVYSKAIEMFAKPQDLLIAISSSGKSANILNAVAAATKKGCRTVTLSGFNKDAPLIKMGDLNFYVEANEYGLVEVAHSALIHYLTDTICSKQKGINK